MDLQYNKTDSVVLPITNTRISASEYNQIAGSLMQIITSAGLTPDGGDNTQLLNAVKSFIGRTVIETYSNGTSWYRVWSDGWCEQGGRAEYSSSTSVAVTFLKPFKDTNFFVNCSSILGASLVSTSYSFQNSQCANLSVSGFTTYVTNNYPKTWYACGYIDTTAE